MTEALATCGSAGGDKWRWNPQGLVIGCGEWEGGPQVKGIRCDFLCELWARGRPQPPGDISVHSSQIWAQL